MIEIRSLAGPGDIDATDEGIIFGLAIPYNRETVIGDLKNNGFREQIAPGSCSKSLREADIVALHNHDSGKPLGRTSAGNLTLANTTRGVEPELKPSDTSYARDLATLVKDKVIRGWSFGFEVIRDDWTDDEGKPSDQWSGTNRVIREMKVAEVSPCTFPAYDSTHISARDAVSAARDGRGEKRGGDSPGDGNKPYGDVAYGDPGYQADGKKRYPLNTKKRVKAALAYIAKPKNAAAYSAKQLSHIKAAIAAAAKNYGVTVSEQNEAELAQEYRCYLKGYDPEAEIEERAETAEPDGQQSSDTRKSKLAAGTAKRVAQISVILAQALDLFSKAGIDSLPEDAQNAISLISSADEHATHIMKKEKLSPSVVADAEDGDREDEAKASAETRETPKPDDSTSTEPLTDDALRAMHAKACRREIDLGL